MDKFNILDGVYKDFFETKLTGNEESEFNVEKEKLQEIDNLRITDASKELLRKILAYIKSYDGKNYISFNMCIYSDDEETIRDILNIIHTNANSAYLPNGEIMLTSFYDIENAEQIDNMYNSKFNIIAFQDFSAFSNKEQNVKQKILHKLEVNMNSKKITILVAKNKDELNEFFLMNDKIKNEFTDFEIFKQNPDIQDLYQEVIKRISENIEVDADFEIKLLDYISATYVNTDLPYPKYINELCEKILFNRNVPEYEKEKSMDEIFEELNSLVGLDNVKQVLKELVSLIELRNKTKDELKIKNINLHMIFLGNPGTGKTTVARIVAEILYNLKYIKKNKLIEVSSKDLVAEYVGQTAPKTMAVIQKALGGVLFIDEAYSLATGKGQGNSYNEEAIATLIQAMENNRDNLVVIFAGYTKEMQDFLNLNSGIVSRIGYTIEFADYTTDELLQIFLQMFNKAGFIVSKEAEEKAKQVIEEYKDTKNFGNARFARNLYEKTIVKHAQNTNGETDRQVLKTIKADDISTENLLMYV